MFKKNYKYIFFNIFFTFIFLVTKHYFSEQNLIFTNKSRSSYSLTLNKYGSNLPLLKNDTNNIIIYKNGLEKFKNKRKKRIWEKLISNKMNRKAVIFGIQKHRLTINEKLLFRKAKPWGIILFSRNIKNHFQLKNLVDDIKNFFKDEKYPILIDQEGGKVSRLNKIIDLSFFSQNFLETLHKR